MILSRLGFPERVFGLGPAPLPSALVESAPIDLTRGNTVLGLIASLLSLQGVFELAVLIAPSRMTCVGGLSCPISRFTS
jgi:hypothetical protein